MKRVNHVTAILLLMASAGVSAAPVTYTFDSVSRFDTGRGAANLNLDSVSVTGILQNAATPTTVSFQNVGIGDYGVYVNRCIPIVLTMIEKPGKYVLYLTIDPAQSSASQFISCGLEVKS